MKRLICFALVLTLALGAMTACGCQNVSDRVDGMITEATGTVPGMTAAPTQETTRPTATTTPGTQSARPDESTGDTGPTTDFSRAPENVNGGTNYWMDPKEDTGASDSTGASDATRPSDMARSRGRMDGRN